MKSQKNLLIAFTLGIVFVAEMFAYGYLFVPGGEMSGNVSTLQFLVMFVLVILIFVFAVRSLLKKESTVGAIILILGDFLLFMFTMLLLKGFDRWF